MPEKYEMELDPSVSSKELPIEIKKIRNNISKKLRDDLLRKYFGYKDDDILEFNTKYQESYGIMVTGDPNKQTTDYEWEQIILKSKSTKITITLTDERVKFYTEFLNGRRLIFVEIEDIDGSPIGQIGLLGNKAVIIVSYRDEYDLDKDGSVDPVEWIAGAIFDQVGLLKNEQFTKVALKAITNPKVLSIDSGFPQKAYNIYLSFAAGLVISGVYEVYLSQAVASAASYAGRQLIGHSLTRKYLIEKGAEKAVEAALKPLYQ